MKKIKLKYISPYSGFNPLEDPIYLILTRFYDVELCEDADYVIGFSSPQRLPNRKCIKLQLLGENIAPDFNLFDYALGFDDITFADRYLRYPLFARYPQFPLLAKRHEAPSAETLLNRKFCSFVVSNGRDADPMRDLMFDALSKYKKVDSGGRYRNNIGGPVPRDDKCKFCRGYKFNIAFENSCVPGYTTEKILEPLTCFSVPIYYGNPNIEADFRADCMVRVRGPEDVARAVEEIIYLDQHDDEYVKRCTAPCLTDSLKSWDARITAFLRNIFDPPFDQARRLCDFGFQRNFRDEHRLATHLLLKYGDLYRKVSRIVPWV